VSAIARVQSFAFQGIETIPVEVQVQIAPGLPAFLVVGLPDKAVAESRERVRAALTALGLSLPPKRVLINLFDNAVAAMEGQGRITVFTDYDRAEGSVRLAVCDEGCGIEDGVYSQLFEPYFSTKQGGTGLGLAIVQRIVTDHGGFVRVGAHQPRGTRFTIEFPDSLLVTQRVRLNPTHSLPADGMPEGKV
jgi:signal transduction histidine kinase